MFQMLMGYVAVLAVASIYYTWRDAYVAKHRKRAVLNERVALMLWTAANRAG
jgi:membrane-bound metal-dependent hydrolase YbcI (DUF457 family)